VVAQDRTLGIMRRAMRHWPLDADNEPDETTTALTSELEHLIAIDSAFAERFRPETNQREVLRLGFRLGQLAMIGDVRDLESIAETSVGEMFRAVKAMRSTGMTVDEILALVP